MTDRFRVRVRVKVADISYGYGLGRFDHVVCLSNTAFRVSVTVRVTG